MKGKAFAVFGLGRFGRSVAETLHSMGFDVIAVDKCEDCVNSISSHITHVITGDASDEHFLNSIGARNFIFHYIDLMVK